AINHQGIVEFVNGKTMRVRIEQTSACFNCDAKRMCSSADKQDKWIDISSFSGTYQVGQKVTVTGKASAGLKAVALAYLFPLVLMMAALTVSFLWLFPGNDGVAALIAISVALLYYLILYPLRATLKNQFIFTVKPYTEDPVL
ncbi:MAG: SoxR reducing system RseC family protein, partial [Bacteroidales bacterium]|nr:SoxR reducing system RseC family protein [Bacteroidales bacterium]